MDGVPVGLEAAHVRWWSQAGPDAVDNGLALCSQHHLLLDRGVLGLTGELTLDVSPRFEARSAEARRTVTDLAAHLGITPSAVLSRRARGKLRGLREYRCDGGGQLFFEPLQSR
jgi:putative restriction endonuclease